LACGDVTSIFYPQQSPVPACLRDLGVQPVDAPCRSELECESGRCSDTECGRCLAQPLSIPPLEGEPCTDRLVCAAYLSCELGTCSLGPCDEPGCHDFGRSCGGIDATRYCPLGTECLNQNDRGSGQCVAYALDGEACASWSGPACRFPARCIANRCTLPSERRCP
jgi:hypothetical protein